MSQCLVQIYNNSMLFVLHVNALFTVCCSSSKCIHSIKGWEASFIGFWDAVCKYKNTGYTQQLVVWPSGAHAFKISWSNKCTKERLRADLYHRLAVENWFSVEMWLLSTASLTVEAVHTQCCIEIHRWHGRVLVITCPEALGGEMCSIKTAKRHNTDSK